MWHGKETKFGRTFEVVFAQDRAIVFAGGFVELDSNPNALFEISRPDESNCTGLPIVDYMLANFLSRFDMIKF